MPHRCLECEHIIKDGSDSLLNGCPKCNNQRWEYVESKNQCDENSTQKSARTEFVDKEELPSTSAVNSLQNPTAGNEDEDSTEKLERLNNVEKIESELNQQYDGINVTKDGRYEINLSELYRGDNFVIDIGEDGAYEVKKVNDD